MRALCRVNGEYDYKARAEMLLARTKITDTGCKEFLGSPKSKYAEARIPGKPSLVHRLIYEQLVGPIPTGLRVCHRCNNPKCINPDHLFVSTSYRVDGEYNYKARAKELLARTKLTDTGCKEFLGSSSGGYAVAGIPGNNSVLVHRFVYEQFIGSIPEGMCVCHTCDNRVCINPDHLFLGTSQDNAQDKMRKGRWKGGKKIDNALLERIQEYFMQGFSAGVIGTKLGVSHTTVLRYLHNRQGACSAQPTAPPVVFNPSSKKASA